MPFSVGIIIGTINTIHTLNVYAHGPAKRDRNLMNQCCKPKYDQWYEPFPNGKCLLLGRFNTLYILYIYII